MKIQEENIELHKKAHGRICVRDITFFWLHVFFVISFFVTYFVYSLPFVYSNYKKKKNFAQENGDELGWGLLVRAGASLPPVTLLSTDLYIFNEFNSLLSDINNTQENIVNSK